MQRYAEESLPLAEVAAARSLDLATIRPEAISHLITVSCTGFFAPGIDIGLVKRLGLSPTVGRLHVGFMGCHGVLNAMQAARATVLADPAAVVLLCAVELCSLHYRYGSEPDTLVANALFADGAAAMVGLASAGRKDPWRLVSSGSYLFPDCEDGMTWKIGNHGFEMTLSSRVPKLICGNLRPWLEGWLAKSGRRVEEIRSWAIHPGGPRILSSVAETLRLPETAIATSVEILAQHGNMSSPTILFVLRRLQEQGSRPPCVVLGFGPGLVAEAALLE
jgi:predicted naringenin-chalcone synthase